MLDVLLDRTRTALENFSDLTVPFPSGDPFDYFELALSKIGRLRFRYA